MTNAQNLIEYVLSNQAKACRNGKDGIAINFRNQNGNKFFWVMIDRTGDNITFRSNDLDLSVGCPPSLDVSVDVNDIESAIPGVTAEVIQHIDSDNGLDIMVLAYKQTALVVSSSDETPILVRQPELTSFE